MKVKINNLCTAISRRQHSGRMNFKKVSKISILDHTKSKDLPMSAQKLSVKLLTKRLRSCLDQMQRLAVELCWSSSTQAELAFKPINLEFFSTLMTDAITF